MWPAKAAPRVWCAPFAGTAAVAGRSTRSLGCMRIAVALLLAEMSFVVTCGTACAKRPVLSEAAMKNHCTGYPVAFICQDLSRRYDPQSFPQDFAFTNPKDTGGFSVEVENLLISWLAIFAMLALPTWLAARAIGMLRRRNAT